MNPVFHLSTPYANIVITSPCTLKQPQILENQEYAYFAYGQDCHTRNMRAILSHTESKSQRAITLRYETAKEEQRCQQEAAEKEVPDCQLIHNRLLLKL